MKTFLLNIALLAFVFSMYGQTFQLTTEDGDDITNTTITLNVDTDSDPFEAHIVATNISSETKAVKVKKIEDSLVDGTMVYMCWGINCYGPTTFETPTAASLEPNAHEVLLGDYSHAGIEGTTVVTYVFFDEANLTDTVFVTVEYVIDGSTTIHELEARFALPYPNPATDIVSFDYSNAMHANLSVFNSIGQKVKEFEILENSGTIHLDVALLPTGLYFYEIRRETKLLSNGKIIVSK